MTKKETIEALMSLGHVHLAEAVVDAEDAELMEIVSLLGDELEDGKELQEMEIAQKYHAIESVAEEHFDSEKSMKERVAIQAADLADDLARGAFDEYTRENARDVYKMQMDSNSKFTTHFLELLTLIILVPSSIVFLYMMITSDDPLVTNNIMEFMKNILLLVIGFWFGSSLGSKRKSSSIERELREDDS